MTKVRERKTVPVVDHCGRLVWTVRETDIKLMLEDLEEPLSDENFRSLCDQITDDDECWQYLKEGVLNLAEQFVPKIKQS